MNRVSAQASAEAIKEIPAFEIGEVAGTPLVVSFDGGMLSSDGGALLLSGVESQGGILSDLAGCIEDQRHPSYVTHPVAAIVKQRVIQICCGYEDANDSNVLRRDPILKLVVGRDPERGEDLASQPTVTRLENAVSRKELYGMAYAFVANFIASYEEPPELIVLDFDDTQDEVHGDQQLSLFNGSYRAVCYLPLHVYEGNSGKLITTLLKPGKRLTGKQCLAIVKRLVKRLREAWPETLLVFRGDGHFTYPEVMEWIEAQERVLYVTGLTGNPRLEEQVMPVIEEAQRQYARILEYQSISQTSPGDVTVTRYHSFYYQAASWSTMRRVVAKVEISSHGRKVRYTVTDMEQARAKALYKEVYCARGKDELYIKDHKVYLKSDRTSCHRFLANQFRLFLHSAAYVLLHALRTEVLRLPKWRNVTIQTLRLTFLKIAARVRTLQTRIKIEFPSTYPLKRLMASRLQLLATLGP